MPELRSQQAKISFSKHNHFSKHNAVTHSFSKYCCVQRMKSSAVMIRPRVVPDLMCGRMSPLHNPTGPAAPSKSPSLFVWNVKSMRNDVRPGVIEKLEHKIKKQNKQKKSKYTWVFDIHYYSKLLTKTKQNIQ